MRLKKANKKKVIFTLDAINRLHNIDYEIHEEIEPDKIQEHDKGSWWFLDFENVLDIVYLQMVGKKEIEVYDSFRPPANTDHKKPIAWYKTRFNPKGDYPDGPAIDTETNYSGFIPDRINDVILDRNLEAEEKYKLLIRFFEDLIFIKRQFKRKKKHEKRKA